MRKKKRLAKRNLTLQLEEELLSRARVLAARRGTSISGLVARELEEIVDHDARYEEARRRALRELSGAIDRGGRRWKREDLYER